jgi:hypothetical protein
MEPGWSTDGGQERSLERAPRVVCAARLLLEAREHARAFHASAWEFAVEIDELRACALTTTDLRWLICHGYVRHAVETTRPERRRRAFRRATNLMFTPRACFVLTEAGTRLARAAAGTAREPAARRPARGEPLGSPRLHARMPRWDAGRRELRVGPVTVKKFRVPAPNQEVILASFQEERWPHRIDDPLPPHGPAEHAPTRLHDTINRLNRSQKNRLIHFSGDGSGRGVCWDAVR